MSLNYKVWTEEEVDQRNVTPAGDYPFEIVTVQEKRTKSGMYDMIELNFNYWDSKGTVRKCRDWIVFMEGMDWKLRHLAKAIGSLELYEAGTLGVQALLGKTGVLSLGIKERIDNGEKKIDNHVKDYLEKGKANVISPIDPTMNDDIPF